VASRAPSKKKSKKIPRLKKRAEFVELAKSKRKAFAKGLGIQADDSESELRIGVTASKKVGSAVKRNRAKRRLRAVAQEILPYFAEENQDIVLIAKPETITRPYDSLKKDLVWALHQTKATKKKKNVQETADSSD
jgi:ribonuclease P protein component